jgi:hypothetical protein
VFLNIVIKLAASSPSKCFKGHLSKRTHCKYLKLVVELPGVKSSKDIIECEVNEKQLILQVEKPEFYLDLSLPFVVESDTVKAAFKKGDGLKVPTLTLTMTVVPVASETYLNAIEEHMNLETDVSIKF